MNRGCCISLREVSLANDEAISFWAFWQHALNLIGMIRPGNRKAIARNGTVWQNRSV